tara:strand:+ start:1144 stop:1968 length:825 start_codon:yes stop_codon:yes gene_type:complete
MTKRKEAVHTEGKLPTDELLEKLSFNSPRTLTRLVQKGIVDAPKRMARPNGPGVVNFYSERAVDQAISADKLRQEGNSYDAILHIMRTRKQPLAAAPEPVPGSLPSVHRMQSPCLKLADGRIVTPSVASLEILLAQQAGRMSPDEFNRFEKSVSQGHMERAGSLIGDGFNPFMVFRDSEASVKSDVEIYYLLSSKVAQLSNLTIIPLEPVLAYTFEKCITQIPSTRYFPYPAVTERQEMNETEYFQRGRRKKLVKRGIAVGKGSTVVLIEQLVN